MTVPVKTQRFLLWNRISIQDKLALAYALLLALFMASCYLFVSSLQEVRAAQALDTHTRTVISNIEKLLLGVLYQETGFRGYKVKHDPLVLEPYEKGIAHFERVHKELATLIDDNPDQQATLARLVERVRFWRLEYAERYIRQSRLPGTDLDALRASAPQSEPTAVIDAVRTLAREMTDREGALLEQRNQLLLEKLDATRWIGIVMLLSGIGLGILVILGVSRNISTPLSRIAQTMIEVAGGNTSVQVPHLQRSDEVGKLAKGVESFRVALSDLATREWIKTKLAELSFKLQHQTTREGFAQTLLAEITPTIGAAYSAFAQLDDASGRYEYAGGYAAPGGLKQDCSFSPGEGLLGQVAADCEPRLITDLPASFFPVTSAMGSSSPRQLLLAPLVSGNQCLGVLEFALFGTLDERRQNYFNEAIKLSSLYLDSLVRGLATQRLLRTTQQQKERLQISEEELRSQQDELRASNEALQDQQKLLQKQASVLRANEEELRAQTEELRVSNTQLEERTEALNGQKLALEEAQKLIEQKARDVERASQYKSDFLANMSHELRTPLNSLLILAKGLADNEDGNLNADQIESSRIIHDSGRNLLGLINDILDLSKIEAGKMDVLPAEIEIADFMSQVRRNFRHVADEKKLSFEVEVAAAMPQRFVSDGGKINQILNNLLSNAFKFTHQGKVSLRVDRPGAAMKLPELLAGKPVLCWTVTDSGIGLSAEALSRLFQPFEQADSGTSRRYGGTGLGLAITRRLAHLLGGEILVSSETGKGSAFTLVLPESRDFSGAQTLPDVAARRISPPPAVVVAKPALRDDSPSGGILIIEDDPAFAAVLAGIARSRTSRVEVAHTGELGLELARRMKPDGVLLDVGLPGISGWDVIQQMRATPGLEETPVHFISGDDVGARAQAVGAASYLRKPVSRDQVMRILDQLPVRTARRILLVEDNAIHRSQIRQLLKDESAELQECATGEEALQLMAGQTYDLLIMDIGLPGMDGFEFLEAASARGPLPPVVVHSSRDLTREESLKLREYTDSILVKGNVPPRRLLDEATLFLHSLSRKTPSEPAPVTPALEVPAELKGRTVLVVDDDMRNIFALSKALRSRGMKVMMAQDGPKALAQLEASPEIQLVLMDIMMPGMDGYEVMTRIRQQAKWAQLPIIAVTAKAMQGDREKCLKAGANEYCSKPIDMDQLTAQIRQLLGAKS